MPLDSLTEAQLLLRIGIAAALAAAVEWERERARKIGRPAYPHPRWSRGRALHVHRQALHCALPGVDANLRADPIRVIQGVALGIGFLGGGVISADARAGSVSGLTTAASVWSTAVIGIAAGLSYYLLAGGATLLQLVVLHVFGRLERRLD